MADNEIGGDNGALEINGPDLNTTIQPEGNDSEEESNDNFTKKTFEVDLFGENETLVFVRDCIEEQLNGKNPCYIARAENTTIHLFEEDSLTVIYSFKSKAIAEFLDDKFGVVGFLDINCDDVTNIKAEVMVMPAGNSETENSERDDANKPLIQCEIGCSEINGHNLNPITQPCKNNYDEESEGNFTKKTFEVDLLGGNETLEFVRDCIEEQLNGKTIAYIARAEDTTIHLFEEDGLSVVYSFKSKVVSECLDDNFGVVGFLNFNCDDITNIKAEVVVMPTGNSEAENIERDDIRVPLIHYEMSYLVDSVNIDYRRKTIMDGRMNLNIVGTKYRDNYEEIKDTLEEGLPVVLKPEPTNEFDPNALAFYLNEDIIGYLPKDDQPFAKFFMARGQIEATISKIDGNLIDTEVKITKDMIDFKACENSDVHFFKNETFRTKGFGRTTSCSMNFKEFADAICS